MRINHKFKRKLVSLFSVLLIIYSVIMYNSIVTSEEEIFANMNTKNEKQNEVEASNTPIIIETNDDFDIYNIPGEGTKSDPYEISGLTIHTSETVGISISGTTKYIIIRNCDVSANRYGIFIESIKSGTAQIENNQCNNNYYAGIGIKNSNSIVIKKNTCTDNDCKGIYVFDSDSLRIEENICMNNNEGIEVENSKYVEIINNICNKNIDGIILSSAKSTSVTDSTFKNNYRSGILIGNSHESEFKNNLFEESGWRGGIWISSSDNVKIKSNTFNAHSADGICIGGGKNALIQDNIMYDCGIGFMEYDIKFETHKFENNLINGLPYEVFIGKDNMIYNSNSVGQAIFIKCENIIISNISISKTSIGLFLFDCKEILISNCIFEDNYRYGILVRSSWKIRIKENILEGNHEGIVIDNSSICDVRNNKVKSNHKGIVIGQVSELCLVTENNCFRNNIAGVEVVRSIEIVVYENNCSFNREGINIQRSENCLILQNYVKSNSKYGIYSSGSSCNVINNTCILNGISGISLFGSDNSILLNNTSSFNFKTGIYLAGAYEWYDMIIKPIKNCSISFNTLKGNREYGIFLDKFTEGNIIHHNNFFSNALNESSQAFDNGTNNMWFDIETYEGNYWSNLNESEHYLIEGIAESIDYYPLEIPSKCNSFPTFDFPEFSEIIIDTSKISFCLINVILFTSLIFTLLKRKKRRK